MLGPPISETHPHFGAFTIWPGAFGAYHTTVTIKSPEEFKLGSFFFKPF